MTTLYHSKCNMSEIKEYLESRHGYDFNQILNPPCTLKYLLKTIEEPLLTYKLYDNYIIAVNGSGEFNVPIALIKYMTLNYFQTIKIP